MRMYVLLCVCVCVYFACLCVHAQSKSCQYVCVSAQIHHEFINLARNVQEYKHAVSE